MSCVCVAANFVLLWYVSSCSCECWCSCLCSCSGLGCIYVLFKVSLHGRHEAKAGQTFQDSNRNHPFHIQTEVAVSPMRWELFQLGLPQLILSRIRRAPCTVTGVDHQEGRKLGRKAVGLPALEFAMTWSWNPKAFRHLSCHAGAIFWG